MTVGMILGVEVIHPAATGDYGVAVLYLISICEVLQWMFRQILSTESYFVSAQRIIYFQ
jgi:hypothetical protein